MTVGARVTAVVVTFDRAQLLDAVLSALSSQTRRPDRTIVVDNGSRPDVAAVLDAHQGVTIVRPRTNLGGAGGFARGLAWALHDGADAVWLMDDDAVPEAHCLEALLDAATAVPDAPYVCPVVLVSRGHEERNLPFLAASPAAAIDAAADRHVAVAACSFVGPLVRADVARRTHLPLADFFIWHDDTEYTARLAAHGPGRLVLDARIDHRLTGGGPRHFVPNRARINIRNLVWCLRSSRQSAIRWRAWAEFLRATVIGQFASARGTARAHALRAVTAGLTDGLRHRPRARTVAEEIALSLREDGFVGALHTESAAFEGETP